MKVYVVLFAAIIAASQAASSILDLALKEWVSFKIEFHKRYDELEELSRMKTFFQNYLKVKEHNENYEKGLVTYKLALNKFSDIPHEELSQTIHGYKSADNELSESPDEDSTPVFVPPNNVTIPDFVDWRKVGAVTPVKDQGPCGSCWAFSSTGALEGQHFLTTVKLVSLSEQNLIDCAGHNNCHDGGSMVYAFNYVKKNRGIDTENGYPYEGFLSTCRYNLNNRGADDIGYVNIKEGNEEDLKAAVATVGPISVAIDAHHESFHFYKEGIWYEPNCSKTKLTHAVLIVGYGTEENGADYWLVKNSWGVNWGDQGYIKIARNQNMCGIANDAMYPLV